MAWQTGILLLTMLLVSWGISAQPSRRQLDTALSQRERSIQNLQTQWLAQKTVSLGRAREEQKIAPTNERVDAPDPDHFSRHYFKITEKWTVEVWDGGTSVHIRYRAPVLRPADASGRRPPPEEYVHREEHWALLWRSPIGLLQEIGAGTVEVRRPYFGGTSADSTMLIAMLGGINPLRLLKPDYEVETVGKLVRIKGRLLAGIITSDTTEPPVEIWLDPAKGYAPVRACSVHVPVVGRTFDEQIETSGWQFSAGMWLPKRVSGKCQSGLEITYTYELQSVVSKQGERPAWLDEDLLAVDYRLGRQVMYPFTGKLPALEELRRLRDAQERRQETPTPGVSGLRWLPPFF